ncbi:uncharacterized protein LOC125370135 [Ricinus communis]|uniref:uncharacterized protein LOC125370135 n=1 Tax=Ricinus communis TaxID=3988 RepID=UPI00201A8402|nr:uncharacterized protein LOC125370135 [Ricinus communis]
MMEMQLLPILPLIFTYPFFGSIIKEKGRRKMKLEKAIMKRNASEKMRERKKGRSENKKIRFLITINVLGSAGPLRFVVDEDVLVAGVIDTALKIYSSEGRLPVLGVNANNVLLYCQNATSDALEPWQRIGSYGERNFVLCKRRKQQPQMTEARSEMISRKAFGWKSWLNKSFALTKILSH